jgi:hypothetical protein
VTWDFLPEWTLRLGLRLTDDQREVTSSAGFGAHIYVLNRPRTFGGQVIVRFE